MPLAEALGVRVLFPAAPRSAQIFLLKWSEGKCASAATKTQPFLRAKPVSAFSNRRLLVVRPQRPVELAGGVFGFGRGFYEAFGVRRPDAPGRGVDLDPVGQDGAPVRYHVLQNVAHRVVDGLLDLADSSARGVPELVALHGRVRVFVSPVFDVFYACVFHEWIFHNGTSGWREPSFVRMIAGRGR